MSRQPIEPTPDPVRVVLRDLGVAVPALLGVLLLLALLAGAL